jgi:aspartyl-tRNA(Asn)/glutamyl-tRNA(Gln) amidotransferase subunit C
MVDKTIVEYVAKLTRINVSEREKEHLAGQLSKILSYIDKLKELDTEGVEPLRSLNEKRNVFRKDVARDSGKQQAIINNSPSTFENHFKIPKVIG